MPDSKNLRTAKVMKYDEFYTRYEDIAAELGDAAYGWYVISRQTPKNLI